MALSVKIRKNLGKFSLRVAFEAGDEIFALLGASGCGKSVTLRCIAGIMTPDEGRIVLDGRVLFDSEKHINLPPQERRIGYLFQQYALFPNMTVEQNILTGVREKERKQKKEKLRELVELFRLSGLEKKRPAELSGGQQQRVALARIFGSRPEAILLDEPFSALDSFLKWQLENEVADRLRAFGGTTVWVSHDRDEVYRNCQHICVVDRGSSSPVVTMKELFSSPGTVSAARLSGCKNFADFVPAAGSAVTVPLWNRTLKTARPAEPGERVLGVRAHHILLAEEGTPGAIPCRIVRITEEVFSTVAMLLPEGADEKALPIRMESEKALWENRRVGDRVTVLLPPKALLLLRE